MQNRDKLIQDISQQEEFPFRFEDWEQKAKETMEEGAFAYVYHGAGSEETYYRNQSAFKKWALIPRMLRDVSQIDMSIHLFGKKYTTPFLLAPIGMQKLANGEGELATAKAAESLDIPFIVSTVSSYSMEAIANVAPKGPKWFQLYWSSHNTELSFSMVERAENAGYEAIVLTVDTVMAGWRIGDMKSKFSPLSLGYGKGNYMEDPIFLDNLENHEEETILESILDNIQHPGLTWDAIAQLKKRTKLPILIKGILHPEDAKLALEYSVDGLIVSNHGGRQLDGVIASIDALPEVIKAVDGKIPVLFDSGVRQGIDAVKALALGAKAVLIGRPYYYGLAVHGEKGVRNVMERLIQETEVTLALSGISQLSDVSNIAIKKDL
ncbi:isopentenyl diphosphate isomerase/L-lactate dehydrogenase-like FMN-dependent dehydrogenase [Gracilibacillus halotolerans]|uniref:L-lactate oxidase n=1 Tax=Gracilibacillus halotolerans TaxID=74386 RepID=A0A841RN68_9BACI|nr:alpha-hydroxy-acid oxidizing protein [Gracilibacillus halotolerans]MBB6512118.1 isopentenyl diphosphate isomerase/L-lactate dehydrogenase-like FMN-dependent dehydrogenase [Gracilibacillus halotolerans]